jgi:hypothetical protein
MVEYRHLVWKFWKNDSATMSYQSSSHLVTGLFTIGFLLFLLMSALHQASLTRGNTRRPSCTRLGRSRKRECGSPEGYYDIKEDALWS